LAHRKNKSKREKQIKKFMGNVSTKKRERNHRHHRGGGDFTVDGTFSYSGRGFGFCVPDADYGIDDVFISPRET
jgi:hypothetical protein